MRFGSFLIHRKTQYDLGFMKPWVCVHKTYDKGDGNRRILCVGIKDRKLFFEGVNPFKYRY